MEKRLEATFRGHVQGVGFRFSVERLAGNFRVTGFIENLPNGDVYLLAEGEEEELSAFLLSIRNSQLKNYIRDSEITWSPSEGRFNEFYVKYSGTP